MGLLKNLVVDQQPLFSFTNLRFFNMLSMLWYFQFSFVSKNIDGICNGGHEWRGFSTCFACSFADLAKEDLR